MAAVDPSESPKRQQCPAEEAAETSGEKTDAAQSGFGLNREDATTQNEPAESPRDERTVAPDGCGVSGHSDVSVESGAGAEKTTCSSPEDLKSAEKMAEARDSDQRAVDWCETQDCDREAQAHEEGDDTRGTRTFLMFIIIIILTVSFSLQANPSCSSATYVNSAKRK